MDRPRRAALICCHFTRNLAYYRAGWPDKQPIFPGNDLWKSINSNFLDVAVLEWCKLFADGRARHSWRKVVVDSSAFLPQMLSDTEISLREWGSYLKRMRGYRDKFIAHLDSDKMMNIPHMNLAEFAVYYLYDTVTAEQSSELFKDLPSNLRSYRNSCRAAAVEAYTNATRK